MQYVGECSQDVISVFDPCKAERQNKTDLGKKRKIYIFVLSSVQNITIKPYKVAQTDNGKENYRVL